MGTKRNGWRTGVWVLTLIVSLAALGMATWTMQQMAHLPRFPTWIEIQEGPVAHGFDKFYRDMYVKGNIETAGDLEVAGVTDLTGDAVFTGTVTLAEATGTITTSQWLTPTSSFYQLDPATNITITLGACSSRELLILYNNLTSTAEIQTTNLVPAAVITLGEHDIFVGMCDGADWVLMLNQNN